MDYGKSFTYVFEEDNWISKFLVGVVVSLVPIVNFAGYGYMLQVMKNVRDGVEEPLPEWDDFGKFFVDGLKFLIGYIVYFIPVILISFLMIPLAAVADSGGSDEIAGLFAVCFTCLIALFSLAPLFLYPALFLQYAKEDEIGDMFKIDEMRQIISRDMGNYIVVLLMVFFVLGFIASFGLLLCFVGIFLTAWWAQLASAHMIGQLAKPTEKPAENLAM